MSDINNTKSANKDKFAQNPGLIVPKSNPIKSTKNNSAGKTANRLYAGYQENASFSDNQQNIDIIEVLASFCTKSQKDCSVDNIYENVHNVAVETLGYNFTAFGIFNQASNCINIKLRGRVGNTFTSRIFLTEENNPIIECFTKQVKKNINDIDFLKIPYLNNSPGIIIPLLFKNNCSGVFLAGAPYKDVYNDKILNVLANYFSLYLINSNLQEKANQNAHIDSLTGLKNHRGFQEDLAGEIAKAKQDNKPLSVIVFDINNISQINRDFSHAKGDEIIKLVAEKISQSIRGCDFTGRYGGDEIAVILPEMSNPEACYMAEYINYSISCCLVDDVGPVRVSIGVATYPSCSSDQEKLLMLAEQAMIISKNKGYKNGMSTLVSAENVDFWNETALDSLAAVISKRHAQLGLNFEEELVSKFHDENISTQSNMLDVVTSLAAAIDAKDTYTRGHSQSVSRYSEALAIAMGLSEEEVKRIKLGALLHDVGKIGIPEQILCKPGKLTDEEFDIIKQHPSIGAKKVLEPIESLRDLIPMVKHHHEHWDGTGYPEGLKSDEIPLAARIVSVADCFHALISDRPYRKGLSLDKAVEILKSGAGVQWDKELVRKFIIIAPSLCTKI
ncbi:MAG: diguanylate cyclase [Candidatus Gastranaerophilales bacterium]|nr:diguanylate cyclase [Candidatus Gastranaerophilales bacterium]